MEITPIAIAACTYVLGISGQTIGSTGGQYSWFRNEFWLMHDIQLAFLHLVICIFFI